MTSPNLLQALLTAGRALKTSAVVVSSVALLLGLGAAGAGAQTTLSVVDASSDVATTLDGTAVDDDDVFMDDIAAVMITGFVDLGTIPSPVDVNACHIEDDGDRLFTTDVTETFGDPGSETTAESRDVIRYDGSDYTIEFDGSTEPITPLSGSTFAVDAVSRTVAGDLLVSFNVSVEFPGAAPASSVLADDEDLVRVEEGGSPRLTVFFDGSMSGIVEEPGRSLDLDAAHVLPGSGRLLVSFDAAGTIDINGSMVDFAQQDLLEFEHVGGAVWQPIGLVYNGTVRYPGPGGWEVANLDCVFVEPAAGCGDGIVQSGEDCDNTGECCTSGCTAVMAGVACTQEGGAPGVCNGNGMCVDSTTTTTTVTTTTTTMPPPPTTTTTTTLPPTTTTTTSTTTTTVPTCAGGNCMCTVSGCTTEPGDCNGNGRIDAGDPICTMNCVIAGTMSNVSPQSISNPCANPCVDCNCNGQPGDVSDPTCAVLRLIECFKDCPSSGLLIGDARYKAPRLRVGRVRGKKPSRQRVGVALRGAADSVASVRVELSADAALGKIRLARRARKAGFSLHIGRRDDGGAVVMVLPPLDGQAIPALGKGRLLRVRVADGAKSVSVAASEFGSTTGSLMRSQR